MKAARYVTIPAGAGLARMLVERNIRSYRRMWIVLVTGFFEPVFYLLAMGVGMASLVGEISVGDKTVPYLVFLAPALMATSAMNGAIYDSTMNVFFKLKYSRLYDSVLATPMGARDVAVGEITWALLRGQLYAACFLAMAAALGAVSSPAALWSLPVAALIGWAFAAIGMAASTYMRHWSDFDILQLILMPMFLLSGTFFPISVFPESLQVAVQFSPLYHAIALLRSLMLGVGDGGVLLHLGVLIAMGVIGTALTAVRIEKRLLK